MSDLVTVYFGRPGSLETIRLPKGGITATSNRQSAAYQLASGGTAADKLLHGRRQFSLSYQALTYADFAQLAAYAEGHNGPGPFALLDPGQRNMLYRNQSAATGHTNDTSNFSIAGTGATISSDSTTVHGVRVRSLKWNFSIGTPAGAVLSLVDPVAEWPGIPCAVRPHSFGFWAITTGGNTSIGLQPTFTWLTASGGANGTSVSSVLTTTGAWALYRYENITPPAGTAFLNVSIAASAATIAAGEALYFSEFMLNEGATLDDPWTPGTGIYPVMPMNLPDVQPGLFSNYRNGPALVLQETGGG